jgi:hypothetical protein
MPHPRISIFGCCPKLCVKKIKKDVIPTYSIFQHVSITIFFTQSFGQQPKIDILGWGMDVSD